MTDTDNSAFAQPSSPSAYPIVARTTSLGRKFSLARSAGRRSRHTSLNMTEPLTSPLASPVPTDVNPTECLVHRFSAWRAVIKELLVPYFKAGVTLEENRYRDLLKLSDSVHLPFKEEQMFLEPSKGGIMDVAGYLKTKTQGLAENSLFAQDDTRSKVIAPLEVLRKELGHKIREIKRLANDFRSDLVKESQITQKLVAQLSEALVAWETDHAHITSKQDPYLCHLELAHQLKRQIDEENYLHRAFLNLERSGRALEQVVVTTIQQAITLYRDINSEHGTIPRRFLSGLMDQMSRVNTNMEWDNFLHSPESDLIHPDVKIRTVQDLDYIGKDSLGIKTLQRGTLERKTKYLRSWSNGYYVLTAAGFLHEFKKDSLDFTPVMSFFIPDCSLGKHTDHNQKDQSHKFVLSGSQAGGLHRGHSWIFRAESHDQMMEWYRALFRVTRFSVLSPTARQSSIAAFNSPSQPLDIEIPQVENGHDFDETDEADTIPFASTGNFIEHLEEPPRLAGGSFSHLGKTGDSNRPQSMSSTSSGTSSQGSNVIPVTHVSDHQVYKPLNSPREGSIEVVVPPPVQTHEQTSEEDYVKEPEPAEPLDIDIVVENIMTGTAIQMPESAGTKASPPADSHPSNMRSENVLEEISESLVGRYPPIAAKEEE